MDTPYLWTSGAPVEVTSRLDPRYLRRPFRPGPTSLGLRALGAPRETSSSGEDPPPTKRNRGWGAPVRATETSTPLDGRGVCGLGVSTTFYKSRLTSPVRRRPDTQHLEPSTSVPLPLDTMGGVGHAVALGTRGPGPAGRRNTPDVDGSRSPTPLDL